MTYTPNTLSFEAKTEIDRIKLSGFFRNLSPQGKG